MIGRRVAMVTVLVGTASSIVLGAWYRSGMQAARAQADAEVEAMRRDGRSRELALADELTAQLEELRVTESARPYLHYQNLFHDPDGASASASVTPSPLATGPGQPLIALHFQIDERGAVTSPSINDEVPAARQASRPDRSGLAALAVARDALSRVAERGAIHVAPDPAPTQVASATPRRPRATAPVATQVVELAPEAYLQNQATNQIFNQSRGNAEPSLGSATDGPRAPAPAVSSPAVPVPAPPAPRPRAVRPAPSPIIITVAPLVWTVEQIADRPTLVAVRRVVTPDGARTQGFTVGGDALAGWLTDRDPGASLRLDGPASAGAGLGIAGGPWRIVVDDGAAIAYARAIGAEFTDSFLISFVPVALLVALCGVLVVIVTARSERLALERSRFAAAAAHELRTPLAGIQLYGDMLADQLGDPAKHRDYAQRVAAEAARLGRVVGNVMGVTQLERGTLAVRVERGDLVAAVREAIDRAAPALGRAGATVELIAPEAITARFDRDAVARVVGNLLDNAEKYARDADDRAITVRVATVGDGVEVAVRDRGPGLPPKLRRGRFRAFTRAAASDAPAGLGLGLALSSALARAMGGSLTPRWVAPGAELVLRLGK